MKSSYLFYDARPSFKLDIETIIDYYLYQNVSSLTQNAVRAIPLGQMAGSK